MAGALAGVMAGLMATGRDQVALLGLYVLAGFVAWHWFAGPEPGKRVRASIKPLAAAALACGIVASVPVITTALLAGRSNRPEFGFIEAGRDVQPTSDVRRMLAQVREPLMTVLHISPEFRPAYDPLLRMATALGRTDVAAARVLLTELQQAQPSRPEAASVLRDLAGSSR